MGSTPSKHQRSHPERPWPPGKPVLIPSGPEAEPDVISIRWDPPSYNGGLKLIGYLVEHRRTGSPHWVRATPILVKGTRLTLSGLEPGMRYQFRISAENDVGRSEPGQLSEAFAVSYQRHVSIAPSFLVPLQDSVAIESEKIELSVVVDGTPNPKISWFKDGFELFSNRRQRILVEGEKSSLIIHQAALDDEGEIKCTATNKAGHVVTKAKLTLEAGAGLRLPRQYEDGLLFELGEAFKLRVGVTGKPDPQVTWYHDGGEVVTVHGRVEVGRTEKHAYLKIDEATRSDRGEYRVTAANKLGTDSSSILVTITDRPMSPGKAHVVMTMGRCVTLSWTAPDDDGGCKIGNYIVEYYRNGWDMWLKAATCRQLTTTLGDLIEGSEYKFRVKAENPYGISDPSDESDLVFIPDPKRGLLEPPAKGERLPTAEEEWKEAKRKHKELETKQWEDTPSQVTLANQVLRKVKMAPKRMWSEDSQGSPPPSPERQLPIAPRRKNRDKKRARAIIGEDDYGIDSPTRSSPQPDSRRYSELSESVHSSAEMMIVLLPDKDKPRKEREEAKEEDDEVEKMDMLDEMPVLPMSLSSPELTSIEPIDPSTLRCAVSSSELLHERTLARMNREIAENEAEAALKSRYGVERKRSFETGRKPDTTRSQSKTYEDKEEEATTDYPILRKSSKDKFLQSDSSIEDFSTRIEETEYTTDYDEGDEFDDEDYESSDTEMNYDFEKSRIVPRVVKKTISEEEETYHPRNMTLAMPRLTEVAEPSSNESSPRPPERKVPTITLNEKTLELSPPVIRRTPSRSPSRSPSPAPDLAIIIPTPTASFESPALPSPNSVVPKPILKVREQPEAPPEKSFGATLMSKIGVRKSPVPEPIKKVMIDDYGAPKNKKKVRIEEPGDGDYPDELVASGEVAQKRRMRRDEPADVVVSHYSDIVKEFGSIPKPKPQIYLNFEELKVAAEKTESHLPPLKQDEPILESPNKNINENSNENEPVPLEEEKMEERAPKEEKELIVRTKYQAHTEFMLDLFLFGLACYVYAMKDSRLAIPLILLLLYRHLHEAANKLYLKYKWLFEKKNTSSQPL